MHRQHDLTKVNGRWACTVCRWEWRSKPSTHCPGLPRYTWSTRPDHLQTKTALGREGFKIAYGQQPVACVLAGDNSRYFMLYDQTECEEKKEPTPAQLQALATAGKKSLQARTCIDCGIVFRPEDARYYLNEDGRCSDCADYYQRRQTQKEARATLQALAIANDWIILDLETTGLDDVAEIVQIGIVDATGHILMDQLIRPETPISSGAMAVHGISDADVASAPRFADVYRSLADIITGQHILAYNAPFDNRILQQTCERYGLPLPAANQWTCVMDLYARHHGEWSNYHNNFRFQSLVGACRREGVNTNDVSHHNAAGDALLTWRLVKQFAASSAESDIHDKSITRA